MNREGMISSFLFSEYLLSTEAVEMMLCDLAVSHLGSEERPRRCERSIGWKLFIPALGWAALRNEVTKTHGLVHRWWRFKPQWLLLAVNCLSDLGDKVKNWCWSLFCAGSIDAQKEESSFYPALFLWSVGWGWLRTVLKLLLGRRLVVLKQFFCWGISFAITKYLWVCLYCVYIKGQHIFGKKFLFDSKG